MFFMLIINIHGDVVLIVDWDYVLPRHDCSEQFFDADKSRMILGMMHLSMHREEERGHI